MSLIPFAPLTHSLPFIRLFSFPMYLAQLPLARFIMCSFVARRAGLMSSRACDVSRVIATRVCARRVCVSVYFHSVFQTDFQPLFFHRRDRPALTGCKTLAQFLFAAGEYSLDIGPDKKSINQEIEEHGITNMIVHQRTAVPFLKSMLVNP